MSHAKVLVHACLAGFALFNIASAPQANASPVTVIRGSHGAAFIVESDRIPVDARPLPSTPSQSFPKLATRGSHGAAQILSASSETHPNRPMTSVPNIIIRGPHSTAFVAQ
ncbi:MAG: hypothetical protein WCD18_22915 [Thermosynechococcaceae cyanobacterium]